MESEPMLTPREKVPCTGKILPRGGLNPQCCIKQDREPNIVTNEPFQPLSVAQISSPASLTANFWRKNICQLSLQFNNYNNNNNNGTDRCNSRFFTISSLRREPCLQHIRASGPGAMVFKSCATRRGLITCSMSWYVPCRTKGQLSY